MRKLFSIMLVAFLSFLLISCNYDKKVVGIAVSNLPEKTEYMQDENFLKEGLKIIKMYDDSSFEEFDDYELDYDLSQIGKQEVIVKYETFETSFNITVNEKPTSNELSVQYFVDNEVVNNLNVEKESLINNYEPEKKDGYYFSGWFKEDNYMWDFAHDKVDSNLNLYAKYLKLDDSHVIVDAYLDEANRTDFTFKTLQELKEADISDNTTVYFTPGVYWTDDYTDPNDANTEEHPGLVGITFPQTGLIFSGITNNADDVRIAGNRGQTVGSKGNWDVIAVGSEFSAYDLTIANYCSFDLVFPRDPSQNVEKRTEARVQAQTLATIGVADKMYFENVRFMSFLNLMANTNMQRAYFKNCYFQLTDDAITGGNITVYENCEFDFYGAHPTGGGSSTLACFLNSKFNIKFDEGILYFAKYGGSFALIDNVFTNNLNEVRWEDAQNVDARQLVYNNKNENGEDIVFAKDYPNVTVNLDEESVKIFKNSNNEYNIYNLLKGEDDWNPTNQNIISPFKLSLTSNTNALYSDDDSNNTLILTPQIYSNNDLTLVEYEYDESLFDKISLDNGILTLKAKLNQTGKIITTSIKATYPNGLESQKTISIRPEKVNAPVISGTPTLSIENYKVKLEYVLDHEDYTDQSLVFWYLGNTENNKQRLIAQTTLNNPYKEYVLSRSDVGYYLTAEIYTKYEFSDINTESTIIQTTRQITEDDIENMNIIKTNFANIAWKDNLKTDKDVWYLDKYKPQDVLATYKTDWRDQPWIYSFGDGNEGGKGGATGKYGLMTSQQGARLLYNPDGEYTNEEIVLNVSPEKTAGQGFGSATDQYMDIYIKYNPITQTGYALRLQRVAKDREGNNVDCGGASVRFTLLSYENGVATVLPFEGNDIMSSAYMPDTTITLKIIGNLITADITTTTEQTQTQKDFNLPHEVHFSYEIPGTINNFGGFGIQHTGTVSNGNRTMLHSIEVKLTSKE